ncbi:phospholipase A1 PLIP2, chloroplastic-like [Prosopis cineraria]|uniref:phospholipase A1 PLIP2, chloroplastic-like n=1 Tax=Prosopis cineraria TaxID=364024 RepID=UPI0024108046|nr:phospholipase A1 PLIP2, chloroplastic-like [Prosopis cineraria]
MDALCFKSSITAIPPAISVSGSLDARTNPSQVSAVGRSSTEESTQKSVFSRFSFKYPLRSLWPGGSGNSRYNGLAIDDAVSVEDREEKTVQEDRDNGTIIPEGQNGNWVLKILHVKSIWRGEQGNGMRSGGDKDAEIEEEGGANDQIKGPDCDNEEPCDACKIDDGDKEIPLDRDSFSRMLRRVSLAEARLYAQMAYLGSLAYCIPQIKPGNLLKHYGLRFVTSSLDKKDRSATKAEKNRVSAETQEVETNEHEREESKEQKNTGPKISALAAYKVAASAASYLHAQTRSVVPFKSSKDGVGEGSLEASSESVDGVSMVNTEVASLMATTDSVTAVVAAKEEVKQAVADDLNSTSSSPCEWFICDDDQSGARFFVIQGSESLESWQANLLFEPVQFEGLDILVHRGIYEAAKGIYKQMLPHVHAHLKSQGSRASFRFTGHSLGGSLALLVNLMLLMREEVPVSSLLPVITFGAPSIMCGGDRLLDKLGLPRNHVQAITMHRDIVPRAFSCNYPNHVAELLKAVNGNFRNHPCLNSQKVLYAPMGELLILQPDEKFSPGHDLLPAGCGLYLLSVPSSESNHNMYRELLAAQLVFLNSPHPLEILSDRSAYGSGGTIQRDHDMNSYWKSVRSVIRHELNRIRRRRREHRRKIWWPLVALAPHVSDAGAVVRRSVVSINVSEEGSAFSGVLKTGRESLKRFSRLVASQHMHLFVVLLFPARLLLTSTLSFH